MSISGIQGQILEVTVVGCQKLKDTEWISRQDPYVCLDYGGTKYRTRTCTDGGKNPTFQEKFMFTLIEGLRELKIAVWNSNTLTTDDFIGNASIQLQKVLSQGYDDCTWTLQTKTGRYAGEVRLIMHFAGAKKQQHASAPSAPPYVSHGPQVPLYSAPPQAPVVALSPYASAPPPTYSPSPFPQYPPGSYLPAATYPSQPSAYPPPSSAYPPVPSAYPPPPPCTTYPPPPYPPQASPYYPPPGPHPGQYPPPPY